MHAVHMFMHQTFAFDRDGEDLNLLPNPFLFLLCFGFGLIGGGVFLALLALKNLLTGRGGGGGGGGGGGALEGEGCETGGGGGGGCDGGGGTFGGVGGSSSERRGGSGGGEGGGGASRCDGDLLVC